MDYYVILTSARLRAFVAHEICPYQYNCFLRSTNLMDCTIPITINIMLNPHVIAIYAIVKLLKPDNISPFNSLL